MKCFRRDNKGVTLVEIIVVVAILAVLGAASANSFGLITSKRADKFVNELDSMLSQCKINTLAGSAEITCLTLSVDAGGTYTATLYEGKTASSSGTEIAREELGKDVTVTVVTAGGTTYVMPADISSVNIGFLRGTGAFRPLGEVNNGWGSTDYITSITVSYGVFRRSVVMVPATGYFYVE